MLTAIKRISGHCWLLVIIGSLVRHSLSYELQCAERYCLLEHMVIHTTFQSNLFFGLNRNNDQFQQALVLEINKCQLHELPKEILTMTELETIKIKFSHLQSVARFGDKNESVLHKLNNLHAPYNDIKVLKNFTFAGANQLQVICLSSNQIASIEVLAFDGLTQLSDLDLSGNVLQTLDWSVFANLNSLFLLNLQNCEIGVIEGFCDMANLTHLLLGKNRLTSLTGIAKVSSLVKLQLVDNVPLKLNLAVDLEGLNRLEILYMGLLPHVVIDIQDFPVLPELTELWLDANELDELKNYEQAREKFPKLISIDLGFNKFSCDYLETMTEALKSINITAQSNYHHLDIGEKDINGIVCTDTSSNLPTEHMAEDYEDYDSWNTQTNWEAMFDEIRQNALRDIEGIKPTEKEDTIKEVKAEQEKLSAAVNKSNEVFGKELRRIEGDLRASQDSVESALMEHAIVIACLAVMFGLLVAGSIWMTISTRRRHASEGSVHLLMEQT